MENAQRVVLPLNSTSKSDNDLMEMFAKTGDQYAFERLYHKYKEPLIRFSFGYTFNQARAEEIVHDTFLKVYRYKDKYDATKNFRTWLWTICKNTNLDSLDKNARHRDESIDELELDIMDADESALEKLINVATKEHVQEAISSLPLTQREALLLWMNDDLNFEEMGTILGKSAQATKNLVHRAKTSLKVKLGERK